MNRILSLIPLGKGLWRVELETLESRRTVDIISARSQREALEKALRPAVGQREYT